MALRVAALLVSLAATARASDAPPAADAGAGAAPAADGAGAAAPAATTSDAPAPAPGNKQWTRPPLYPMNPASLQPNRPDGVLGDDIEQLGQQLLVSANKLREGAGQPKLPEVSHSAARPHGLASTGSSPGLADENSPATHTRPPPARRRHRRRRAAHT